MIRAAIAGIAFSAWALAGQAEGLDEATVAADTRTGIERLLTRAGFGELQKSYALIVGVSDFDDYADLPTTADPLRVRDYLVNEAGFDYVHILTEDKVTKARLEELMLDEFRPIVGASDRFLFYWSGHGETLEVGSGEIGFLPLSESRKTAFSSMVAMSDLSRWDQFISAHQVLYLLDSCFSGLAGAAPQSDLSEITREQLSGPGRHMITAGRVNEQTIAVDELGGSIFTHALLKGLRGAADSRNELGADGLVAVGELKNYLGQEISRLRTNYNWQKTITPQIRDLSGSDGAFFFPVAAKFPKLPEVVTPPQDVETGAAGITPQGGSRDLLEAQLGLIELGFDIGPADGILGFATRRALIAFQTENGLERSGALDDDTMVALLRALVPDADPNRDTGDVHSEDATVATISPDLSIPGMAPPDPNRSNDIEPILVPSSNEWGFAMQSIPGGRFTMGRDNGPPEQGPARQVTIRPFEVATTETTMQQFGYYIAAEGLDFISRKIEPDPTCYEWSDDNRLRRTAYAYNQLQNTLGNFPVSCVNRNDVTDFLRWLNTGQEDAPYRLLSEAEFEFLLAHSDGEDESRDTYAVDPETACDRANIADVGSSFKWRNNSCADWSVGVAVVAQYRPDNFGLYDIRGNLWEWVSDCWRPTHDAPAVTGECETGTVKGASFDDPLDNLHASTRQPVPVKRRQTNIGFRIARDVN